MRGAGLALVLSASIGSAHAATGGPDAFGYTFTDSTEPDGPSFDWTTTTGHVGVPTGGTFTVSLPFDFPFYGTEYAQVSIGDDGVLLFTGAYPGALHECLPALEGAAVLPLWDLLDSALGEVRTRNLSNETPSGFVIHYDAVGHGLTGTSVSFQVRLYEDGVIEVHYQAITDAGGGVTSTVGIDAGDGTALQYSCDAAALTDGLAVRFSPSGGVGDDDDDSATDDDDSATDDDDDSATDDDDDDDDSTTIVAATGCQSECRGLGVRFGLLPVLGLGGGFGLVRRKRSTP